MGGIGKLIAGAARKAYRYVKYGKQIGKVHADGSTLHKGNDFVGTPGTKYLVGRNGDVKKVIQRKRVDASCFRVTQATPFCKRAWGNQYMVTKTTYNNEYGYRYIAEDKFIGEYYPKHRDWYLSSGSNIESTTTSLK